MIIQVIFLDVAPDPAGLGELLAVILLVIGFIVLFAFGLVLFLWYRKRNLRHVEMVRPDILPTEPAQTRELNKM